MSFGGFIGGGSSGVGDARIMADNLFNSCSIPNPAIVHSQPSMVFRPTTVQPIFEPSPFSFSVKPKMEGAGEMGLGGNFVLVERPRAEENESKSGSDNHDSASGDDQDASEDNKAGKTRKYHRHTPLQIQELEDAFKENPHPDDKARLELGRKLNLESKQVKFWFQNRRTQMKTQLERHENTLLKQDNDRLRMENITMKEALRNLVCNHCGSPGVLGETTIEEHHLRLENGRLKDELTRINSLASKFLGRSLSPVSGTIALGNSDLELAVGRNGFGGVSSVNATMPLGLDFVSGIPSALSDLPTIRSSLGTTGFDITTDASMYAELAMAAMEEFLKLAQVDNFWLRGMEGGGESLNREEYTRSFPPCIGMKPDSYVSEATRAFGTVIINSAALIEMVMDANQWTEMFSCMLGKASVVDVISLGLGGTKNGALQVMQAEFQVLTPLVAFRPVKFLRFSKQHSEGYWAVVDVSVDSIRDGSTGRTYTDCRRLPSGFILQDMPNGYSKVIWIEHMEYDDSNVHQSFRPLLRSGLGLGAKKWVATLERQCEFLAVILSSTVQGGDEAVINPGGRRSLAKLAQRMTRNFGTGICATVHNWEIVQVGNADDPRLMMRKSYGNPGEPPGMILSATTTIWLPVSREHLFDYLRNEQTRPQWDVLSLQGPMQQMLHIAKSQDHGNSISLLRSSGDGSNSNQGSILILQETCNDVSGSLIVYAAVDIPAMKVVMGGGDSSCVILLPSGFSIVSDCQTESKTKQDNSPGNLAMDAPVATGGSNGSLLTVGFQILVNSPSTRLTMDAVNTVNALITRTLQSIKSAFSVN